MIELARALAVLTEAPRPEHGPLWAALDIPAPSPDEHADVFLLQLFPYASVQLGPEGRLGGVARDRVAGFFRALGHPSVTEPDHLAFLLGAYATLQECEWRAGESPEGAAWTRAREALLLEHLLPWVPAFARRVMDLGGPAYQAWARLLDELLRIEAGRSRAAATLLPAHLGEAPPLPDPRQCGAAEFVDGLLSPARTGMILTASDLARAASDLGVGRRVGERRFVIRSLLDQDATGFLGWLGGAAASESRIWEAHWLAGSPTGAWWRDRSASTAARLDDLAA
ncbi:MAG: molecular chaperone TorD family protein [Actinobacteria bacterium]|nr:molecular chaperone TorD family protein [Actinomycetota bacterium]